MKRTLSVLVLLFATLVAFSTTAFAADAGVEAATEASVHPGGPTASTLQLVAITSIVLVAGLLLWLAPQLTRKASVWFQGKTHLALPTSALAHLDALAGKAVAYAEEQMRKQAKGLSDVTLPGPLELATRFFVEFGVEHGAADWADDKIKRYLESKLHLERQKQQEIATLATVFRGPSAASYGPVQ